MKYIFLAIIIVFMLMAVMSCNSEKHVAKSYTNKDSLALVEANKMIFTLTSERDEYKRKVEELEHLQISFTEAKPINLDSLRRVLIAANCPPSEIEKLIRQIQEQQTTIRKLADGTLEIKGNISSLVQSKHKLEEELYKKDKHIAILEEEVKKAKTQVRTEIKEVVKEKKVSFIPWWVWLIVAGAAVIVVLKSGWAKNFSIKDL